MNCFSHAFRFLDRDPYFVAGTCIPDWLTLVDRKVRARRKRAIEFTSDPHPMTAEVARGIVQHHDDDDLFHNNPAFIQLNLELALEIREMLGSDAGFRPHLSGHILIEVLLDGFLASHDVSRLDDYYATIAKIDSSVLQASINRFTPIATTKMQAFVPLFLKERYLYDYLEDRGVLYRLNRVLKRARLNPLPEKFLDWLPSVRRKVEEHAPELLPAHDFPENQADL